MNIPIIPQLNSPQPTGSVPLMPQKSSGTISGTVIGPSPTDDEIYNQASTMTHQKYGVLVPPYLLKTVRQQESSEKVDPDDYGRSMGLTADVQTSLGKGYLPDTSLSNSVQNASNYLASRAMFVKPDGSKVDLSTPENMSKWYVQRYVGLLPGQSRMINGQRVSYDQIKSMFEQKLKINQFPSIVPDVRTMRDLTFNK